MARLLLGASRRLAYFHMAVIAAIDDILEPTPSSCELVLDDISHRYGAGLAVDHVSLDIGGGELLALLGPSGCGKTTLLRIIAGFVAQTAGRVVIAGEPVDDLPPNRREVGIVFQNYALFPHMTVAENVAYGLAARGMNRTGQRQRVAEMLELVRLGAMAARYPRQLRRAPGSTARHSGQVPGAAGRATTGRPDPERVASHRRGEHPGLVHVISAMR